MSVPTQYGARRSSCDADGQLRSTSACLRIYAPSILVEYQPAQQDRGFFPRRRYGADPAGTARTTYWNTLQCRTHRPGLARQDQAVPNVFGIQHAARRHVDLAGNDRRHARPAAALPTRKRCIDFRVEQRINQGLAERPVQPVAVSIELDLDVCGVWHVPDGPHTAPLPGASDERENSTGVSGDREGRPIAASGPIRSVLADQCVDVVVVGAGFAGPYVLHKLRSRGLSVRVLEVPELGRTWYYNPAVLDESTLRWTVTTDTGRVLSARFCLMATGPLSAAMTPNFPGLDTFAGEIHHTAHWPRHAVDFTGKRVAVIGTGSSGIQSIPIIAEQAAHLYVFQRTPNYSVPAGNIPLSAEELDEIKSNYPQRRKLSWRSGGGSPHLTAPNPTMQFTPEERRAAFEKRWQLGGVLFSKTFPDQMTDLEANEEARKFYEEKVRAVIDDPVTAGLPIPTDHPIGTKRICTDSNYFQTFNRPNVSLISVRNTPIESIDAAGINTGEARRPRRTAVSSASAAWTWSVRRGNHVPRHGDRPGRKRLAHHAGRQPHRGVAHLPHDGAAPDRPRRRFDDPDELHRRTARAGRHHALHRRQARCGGLDVFAGQ
jgi:hypothetical protein